MQEIIPILSIEHLTHDVLRIVTQKPESIRYTPGQAADISVNKAGWENEIRPFTFTSLPAEDYLEFSIKTYPAHNGVTNQLLLLHAGDSLIIHGVFGTISYKGEGMFIAGGAGITPFIAIFRQLEKENKIGNNKLIFANKTKADIILEKQFNKLLGDHFINVLSDEKPEGYEHGFITEDLIKKHMNHHAGYYYICGPDPMTVAVEKYLQNLHVPESFMVKENF